MHYRIHKFNKLWDSVSKETTIKTKTFIKKNLYKVYSKLLFSFSPRFFLSSLEPQKQIIKTPLLEFPNQNMTEKSSINII